MRRAALFLIVTFAIYAAAQSSGGASAGGGAAGSAGGGASAGAASGGMSVGTTGGAAPVTGTGNVGSTSPNVSPGLNGQPAAGPAAEAPTTNLGPSTTQPLGTGQTTGGSFGATSSTGGFISTGGYGGGYVPLLQTPSASFPSGVTNVPNNPAGISNNPSALSYATSTSNSEGVFNTGAADFGLVMPTPQTKSLGEIAREYRSKAGTAHARVYTNADIQQLDQQNNQPMVSGMGPSANMPANSNPAAGPASPTTPAVGNPPAQPAQNRSLPAGEAQPSPTQK